jgi:transcriptional regulator with XRE-family HTH domain
MRRRDRLVGRRHGLHWQYWQPNESKANIDTAGRMDVDVGGKLRRLREERSLTIKALAERSGLSVNTLSLIENGKSSPSVSTLQQLAMALEVPIVAFFEVDAPRKHIAYVKANQRPRATFDHGTLEDLGAGSSIRAVEPLVVTLAPNAGSGPQDIVHTGYEFVFCLEGRISYTIDGQNYLLEPGDSLLFEAHHPHRWQNLDATKSRSLVVLYPTDENDMPAERHFNQE